MKNWISRFVIDCKVPINSESITFENCSITFYMLTASQRNYYGNAESYRIVFLERELPKEMSIDEVHISSKEIITRFINRLSIVGFCEVSLVKYISTTIVTCEIGETFQVACDYFQFDKKYDCEIGQQQLNEIGNLTVDNNYEIVFELFRKAISSQTIEEKVLMLATCLERFAEIETTEKIINTCKNCGHQENSGRSATRNFLRERFGKDDVNTLFKIRDKIAHGGGRRNTQFYKLLADVWASPISRIADILVEKFNIKPINAQYYLLKTPYVILNLKRNSIDICKEIKALPKEQKLSYAKISKAPEDSFRHSLVGNYNSPFIDLPTQDLRCLFLPIR